MDKIIISSEELRKIGLVVRTAREIEFNVIGKKLGGALIVSRGEKCIELPSETKFKIKTSEKS
ncbi:hypothetical protein K8R61_01265 [bacterium]|nr:hypothetical protein [bacterium]